MRLTRLSPRMRDHWRRWPLGGIALAGLLLVAGCGAAPGSTRTTSPIAALPSSTTSGGGGSVVPSYQHVFVILMENQDYESVIGSSDAPYINGTLVAGGTVFARYQNIAHPSLPNYLALLGGDTFDVANDNNPPHNIQSARNLVDLLEDAGKSWKAYMESMPSNNYAGDADPYEVHHNPFAYFSDITSNAARTNRVVPFEQLSGDLASAASTPTFVWITPNMCDDMHSCPVSDGDTWLSHHVPPLLSSQACRQSKCLLAVVWDEDEGSGHLPALLYGSGVRAGYTSTVAYDHYALLHTIEQAFGLSTLTAKDAHAQPMTDAFSS